MKTAILSNINLFKLIGRMKKRVEVYEPEGYGNWIQPMLGDKKIADYVICIIDGNQLCSGVERFEDRKDAFERINECFFYIQSAVEKHPQSKYLISDIDIVPGAIYPLKESTYLRNLEQAWGEGLDKLVAEFSNAFVFPLKDIITSFGRKEIYSDKMWYLASSRFSVHGEKEIEKKIFQMISCMEGKRKKCLLLDLDNTLWGGIIGEDGIEGIVLSENKEGARYKDFQKKIKDLKGNGVILGIVSKNNEKEARDMIENHPDMVLGWDDFVVKKINWNPKSQNIREIQKEINIGLDSIVFLDDSPVEREEVRFSLPEVAVPDFPEDSSGLSAFIEEIYWQYFLTSQITFEDKIKTELYNQRRERENAREQHPSMESYLKSLNTKVVIQLVGKSDIGRAIQLIQKTNQFNLTVKRYSEGEVLDMLAETKRFDFWIAEISDRFGSNGKSALLIIEKKEDRILLDSFIMSCRVMGRELEKDILYVLERKYLQKGYKTMEAEYRRTAKNSPVADLYDKMGYQPVKIEGKDKYYAWTLKERESFCYSEIQWKDI
ncbi:MAG: HAD-IIIC family phosphatase [Lachnospiraceae bacterium]|nr:HAD-IIIC family phosphatase [Lachnospiraceae bacterium]